MEMLLERFCGKIYVNDIDLFPQNFLFLLTCAGEKNSKENFTSPIGLGAQLDEMFRHCEA